jgi:putative addiction module component (TIGR02574 family)
MSKTVEDLVADSAPDESVEDAWTAEVKQRMANYRAGKIETIGWGELRERLHARATSVAAAESTRRT